MRCKTVGRRHAGARCPNEDRDGASGKRLFGAGTIPRSFRLVDTLLSTTGAVRHVHERAGDLKYGEVEVGQETVIFDSDAVRQ
jgi:hypothetical protein